jgi:hypothetical protein
MTKNFYDAPSTTKTTTLDLYIILTAYTVSASPGAVNNFPVFS